MHECICVPYVQAEAHQKSKLYPPRFNVRPSHSRSTKTLARGVYLSGAGKTDGFISDAAPRGEGQNGHQMLGMQLWELRTLGPFRKHRRQATLIGVPWSATTIWCPLSCLPFTFISSFACNSPLTLAKNYSNLFRSFLSIESRLKMRKRKRYSSSSSWEAKRVSVSTGGVVSVCDTLAIWHACGAGSAPQLSSCTGRLAGLSPCQQVLTCIMTMPVSPAFCHVTWIYMCRSKCGQICWEVVVRISAVRFYNEWLEEEENSCHTSISSIWLSRYYKHTVYTYLPSYMKPPEIKMIAYVFGGSVGVIC